ncbi:sensor domain-containing protein [Nakamurella endophytica]|uniref:sensor domain-containing protein n=1 Tax=Nakamurella endophytica TaxID=1748367 RepID=UPI00166DBE81|nr:diguanylate cyclase [Nakamurella endophytica]
MLLGDLEAAADAGWWTWHPEQGLTTSAALSAVLGVGDPASATGSLAAHLEMVHPADRDMVERALTDGLRSPDGFSVQYRIMAPDGAVRLVRSRGRGETDAAEVLVAAVGVVQDITGSVAITAELARARELFGAELDVTADRCIIGLDARGVVTLFDSGAEQMLGYTASEILGAPIPPYLHDGGEMAMRAAELAVRSEFEALVGRAARGEPEIRRWSLFTKTGRRIQVLISVSALRGPDGSVVGYLEAGTDVTARSAGERARHASGALFEEIFDRIPSGIMLVDVGLVDRPRILRANPALSRITGYALGRLLTMSLNDLAAADGGDDRVTALAQLAGGESLIDVAQDHWLHADGRDIWVQLNSTPIGSIDTRLLVVLVEDVTDRLAADRELQQLALHDPLTGLANRVLMVDRLEHALAATRRDNTQVAVLYVDLDGFKAVNDGSGHAAGDQMLQLVGQRLRSHLRPADTVARVGGDEFVLICPHIGGHTHARALADRLSALLAQPYPIGDRLAHVTASIGVAVSTAGEGVEDVLRAADLDMYAHKRRRRGQ